MTETIKAAYAAKIKTTGGIVGMLRNTAEGEVADILGRYKGQIALKDRGEAYAVRQHIRENHSLDSPNGCPPELRKGTASLVHKLIHAFDEEEPADLEYEPTLDEPIQQFMKEDEPPLQDSPNSITPEDAERMSRESLEVELICDAEDLGELDGTSATLEPTNRFGVTGLVLQAAGFALNRGALTQDQYRAVCMGETTMDDARADFEALPEIETADAKPKKKANGNGAKKSKKRAKAAAKETKAPATWSVWVMDAAETGPEVTVVDARPASEFGGCAQFGPMASKLAAEHPGRLVQIVNHASGTIYPRRKKAKK